MHDTGEFPPVDPIKVGLQGCCPRCGRGKLFDGFIKLKPRCSACGLDYAFADAGDGPAVFVMLIVGFLITLVLFRFRAARLASCLDLASLDGDRFATSAAQVQGYHGGTAISQQCQ